MILPDSLDNFDLSQMPKFVVSYLNHSRAAVFAIMAYGLNLNTIKHDALVN
jgi:hypothetical protein